MQYEIYFRTSRGGIGIPYELAKTEFLAVYHRFGLELKKDRRERHRMSIELPLIPDRVAALAGDLGFTEAIVGQHYEPFRGEEISAVRSGRWLLGWIRIGDYKVHQTEVYVQDKQALLRCPKQPPVRDRPEWRQACCVRTQLASSRVCSRCPISVQHR